MNFYKYLENKITLFESSNSAEYLYKNKILYPIINKTVFVDKQEIEVTDSYFRKKFGSDYLYDPKEKNLKIISRYKTETNDTNEEDKEEDNNIELDSAQYVEVNGVYYPLIELSRYKKISKDNSLKNLNLDDYQTVKKSQMNFKIYTKGSSGGGGNQPTEAEVNELESVAGEETETPPEVTTPETPTA